MKTLRRWFRSERPRVWYRLRWPREVDPKDAQAWLDQLAGAHGRGGIVLEVEADHNRVEHRLAVPDYLGESVVRSARAAVPGLSLEPLDEPAPRPTLRRAWLVKLSTHRRALRTDVPEALNRGLLAVLGDLHHSDHLVLQWLLGPRLRAVAIPNRFKDFTHESWWQTVLAAPLGAPAPVDVEFRNALRAKQSTVGWRACLRLGVNSRTPKREIRLLQQLAGALRVAESPGVKLTVRSTKPSAIETARRPLWWPVVINVEELVGLTGWPLGEAAIPKVQRATYRPLLPSGRIPSKGRVVVDANAPGAERPLCLNPPDALQGLHVLGPTGTGKSTLLLNLIAQDMRDGRGIAVVEPKGDLIRACLEVVPKHRLDDVVLLDPLDSAPIGLNPLRGYRVSPELVADRLLSVFHGLYAEHWGPRVQDMMNACLITLANTPGATLTMLPLLLSNRAFRRKIVGGIKNDPLGLGSFWAWYDSVSEAERAAATAPVMTRLRTFLLRPALRGVLGQASPKFDLRQVFTERRILLVNLQKGRLGPETAALLGSLVVSQLWQAALERTGIDPARRHPVFIYVDEFQDYLHLPVDLSDALSQVRALGVGLTLAHQHLGQLSTSMRSAVMANARSRVTFTLAPEDAAVLARNERVLTAEDFQSLGAYECYLSLVAASEKTAWASGRSRPAPPAQQSADVVIARSREQWGVPREATETAIRELTEQAVEPERIGSRRRVSHGGGS